MNTSSTLERRPGVRESDSRTERDASILLEDEWHPLPEPPTPAFQIMDNSVDVDMMLSGASPTA